MKREDVELFVFKPVSFFYSESMVRFQAEFQHKLLANDWWRLLDIETILARGLTQPVTRVTLDKQTSLFILTLVFYGVTPLTPGQPERESCSLTFLLRELSCLLLECQSTGERETTEAFVIKLQRLQSGHWGPGLENNGGLFILCLIIWGYCTKQINLINGSMRMRKNWLADCRI